MENYGITIILVCLIVSLVSCVPRRRKCDTTQKHHRNGEPIVVDELIKQYEKEHQQFYKEHTRAGLNLEWPALDKKHLSTYCRQYLQYIIPGKNSDSAIGIKMSKTLSYEKEINITSDVTLVQCKIRFRTAKLFYYMTRAPEPNCVYAIKCSGDWNYYKFVIIHKHCDFEKQPLINKCLKRIKEAVIGGKHKWTGQPIAKDKYLLEYELDHQKMFNSNRKEDIFIQWPPQENLNLYCYQYIGKCFPGRNCENVSGSKNNEKLHYVKLSTGDVNVITVKCLLPYASTKLYYHTTRAHESNCVYALLKKVRNINSPFIIIFKHCDFIYSLNDQQTNSQNNGILDTNLIPKTEIKEETFETLESIQFFSED